jgi:hypothetical protein
MQLNPDEFNSFLAEMGQSVTWRRAFACPCVNPESGQARPACPHCYSKGRIWPGAPVPCTTGVAGRGAHKQWLQTGLADVSDVVVSIPSDSPLYGVGPFDRVRFDNRTEPFSLNITKGVNEKIRFFVVSLEKVLYEQEDGTLIDAPLPLVNDDGTLDWSGVELPDGVTFSVTGRRRAEYIAMTETPFDRPHHHGAALPRKVVLRRFDQYLAK